MKLTQPIRVTIFCGGRGSKTLIRELLRQSNIDLTLIVNAYDDGLSTGLMRKIVPGMLGPSDFRKNISNILDLYSVQQYALREIMEYRFPLNVSEKEVTDFKDYCRKPEAYKERTKLIIQCSKLDEEKGRKFHKYVNNFFNYYEEQNLRKNINFFSDCSIGNIVFTGLYLETNQDFNQCIKDLANFMGVSAKIVNVSKGEGYTLVGLKKDGELLTSEGALVGRQNSIPIADTFFIASSAVESLEQKESLSFAEKMEWLKKNEVHPKISDEAASALALSDVIIYGPGTQHSSLFPSYKIAFTEIAKSPAIIKAFVCNVGMDHDIQGLSAEDLIDKGLLALSDDQNLQKTISHIFYDERMEHKKILFFNNTALNNKIYKGAKIVCGNFSNNISEGVHNGYVTVQNIMREYKFTSSGQQLSLHIFLDLYKPDDAILTALEELIELPESKSYSEIIVYILGAPAVNSLRLPPNIELKMFLNNNEFENALKENIEIKNNCNYVALLRGDGEYLIRDIYRAINLFDATSFAVVIGSRTQSRLQFVNSIQSAYRESFFMYRLSWLGAFLVTFLFGARFGIIFSDPLSGFFVFCKNRLPKEFYQKVKLSPRINLIQILKKLILTNCEIAEIPIYYRTFSGFTNKQWRFQRGLISIFMFFR